MPRDGALFVAAHEQDHDYFVEDTYEAGIVLLGTEVKALRDGMPECSGVALGVDRLLMKILKLDRIDAVLAFSTDRI